MRGASIIGSRADELLYTLLQKPNEFNAKHASPSGRHQGRRAKARFLPESRRHCAITTSLRSAHPMVLQAERIPFAPTEDKVPSPIQEHEECSHFQSASFRPKEPQAGWQQFS
jgi:hypothetical protein